ncbi:hypothetical protein VIGAN_11049800 [Vigna angularis var. angularis]|uniref:Aminotransferase-like plant mobile domain-containing protein n=1 Tax=Vigna angularis var. angularis TaxID=157739 RepID=A0A0S3T914_PHAAN|nr:hypothetical protein VIGAN_11049800 [Vigna angularis var. angularis]
MASTRQLPVDMSLLRLQDKHIVKSIWEGNERVIYPRRHAIWITKHVNELDKRVMNILQAAGFIHILKASTMEINHHLVTALVERWRVETHTFHLPLGESSITLEDVALQLGLPIEGHVVTGISSGPLTVFCHQLLGDVPPENNVRGNRIKLSWLNNTSRHLPHDATDQYDMDHEQQFQSPSAFRASPSYHDTQRSASDHVNYQHPHMNSRFQQHMPPTSTYPGVETSYFAFPPSTLFSGGPSSFIGGPSNYFGTSTTTPPSSSLHNVYRPTYDS